MTSIYLLFENFIEGETKNIFSTDWLCSVCRNMSWFKDKIKIHVQLDVMESKGSALLMLFFVQSQCDV